MATRRTTGRRRLMRRTTRKKLLIALAVILIVILLAIIFKGCGTAKNNKNERLREQISSLQKENEEMSTQLETVQAELSTTQAELQNTKSVGQIDQNSFVAAMFWQDGNFYEDTETEFYSDPFCSSRVEGTLRFSSPIICGIDLSNGQTVYAVLSNSGIVYSVYEPDLEIVEE